MSDAPAPPAPPAPPAAPDPLRPTLTGRVVRLEPLSADHTEGLLRFALTPSLWRFSISAMRDEGDVAMYVARALAERDAGAAVPLVVVRRSDGVVVGSTRFAELSAADRRVEIGWTFYDPAVQGTAVNADTKRAMLGHAFDTWRLLRVEFKADARNERSRAALAAVGATFEGTLRRHMRTASGGQRDTVYYSVIADEWPDVRARLDARIAAKMTADGA